MKVLVTEAEKRNSLAIVRALACKGAEVHAAGHLRMSQAFYSRYCSGRFRYPSPRRDADKFHEALRRILESEAYDVLLPAHESTTRHVTKRRKELQTLTALAVPDEISYQAAGDKNRFAELLTDLGVDIPGTYCTRNFDEAKESVKTLGFPCVIKPRRGVGAIGLRYLNSFDELKACYQPDGSLVVDKKLQDLVDPVHPVLQEFIPGETHDLCFLAREGELRAAMTQRRLKTYPARGGRGIVLETTSEPQLIEIGSQILRHLGWHGPGQLEFRIDSRDGKPKVIEMNTRFWGTLDLAVQAGMDLPHLTCRMAVDGDIEPVYEYQVGLFYRMWFPYEFASALQEGTLRAVAEAFALDNKARCAIWPSDPLPHLVESIYLATS